MIQSRLPKWPGSCVGAPDPAPDVIHDTDSAGNRLTPTHDRITANSWWSIDPLPERPWSDGWMLAAFMIGAAAGCGLVLIGQALLHHI